MLVVYGLPAEHWKQLRTSNLIESAFATIRLYHQRTRESSSRGTSDAILFELGKSAEKRWRGFGRSPLPLHSQAKRRLLDPAGRLIHVNAQLLAITPLRFESRHLLPSIQRLGTGLLPMKTGDPTVVLAAVSDRFQYLPTTISKVDIYQTAQGAAQQVAGARSKIRR